MAGRRCDDGRCRAERERTERELRGEGELSGGRVRERESRMREMREEREDEMVLVKFKNRR